MAKKRTVKCRIAPCHLTVLFHYALTQAPAYLPLNLLLFKATHDSTESDSLGTDLEMFAKGTIKEGDCSLTFLVGYYIRCPIKRTTEVLLIGKVRITVVGLIELH